MNIEATAYALLVYVPGRREEIMDGIVKWLNAQRLQDGGWASTQVNISPMIMCIVFSTNYK